MRTARLRLRDDAYHVRTSGGVAVLTHEGLVPVEGASIHRWVERLAPFLDGRYTLDELTASLPADRRAFVERLVTALLERGVVREVGDEEPHALGAEELDAYRAEVGFAGSFTGSAARTFQRWRDSGAVVVGAGTLVPAVTRAALRSGLRSVRVVVTPEAATDTTALGDAAREAAGRDAGQRCEWETSAARTLEEVAAALAGADLVLHVADRPAPDRSALLERCCESASVPVAELILAGAEAWLSPAGHPGTGGSGWRGGWRRHHALVGDDGPPDAGGTPTAPPRPAGATAVVLAGQMVQDAFRYVTGLRPAPDRPRLTRIRLDTLHSEVHAFLAPALRRPAGAEPAAAFSQRVAELRAAPALPAEEFSRRAAAFVDARLGVFGEIGEGDLAQLPVHVTRTTVSDPVGLLEGRPRPVVTGAGGDFATARYRAALRALAVYGSLMVDPRRLLTADGRALFGAGPGADEDPHAALAAPGRGTGEDAVEGWVRAVDLTSGEARLLTAARVFPALRGPAGPTRPYAAPCGTAAAYGWREALQDGLVQHCRRLTIADALTGDRTFPRVEPEAAPLDGTGQQYLTLLAAIGEPVAVHDVTGTLGVPTFACQLADDPVVYGCGVSATRALRDGLEQLLLGYQARVNREPEYAPAPVGDLPARSRGQLPRRVAAGRPLGVDDLVTSLARCDLTAAAVPLDHDPEVHRRMPNIVRVVVTGDRP